MVQSALTCLTKPNSPWASAASTVASVRPRRKSSYRLSVWPPKSRASSLRSARCRVPSDSSIERRISCRSSSTSSRFTNLVEVNVSGSRSMATMSACLVTDQKPAPASGCSAVQCSGSSRRSLSKSGQAAPRWKTSRSARSPARTGACAESMLTGYSLLVVRVLAEFPVGHVPGEAHQLVGLVGAVGGDEPRPQKLGQLRVRPARGERGGQFLRQQRRLLRVVAVAVERRRRRQAVPDAQVGGGEQAGDGQVRVGGGVAEADLEPGGRAAP